MMSSTNLLAYFADVEDPRDTRKSKHPLMNILVIAILGSLSGADTWVDIAEYGQAKAKWLGTFLDLTAGLPSHDTFGRVFRWLKPEAFQSQFIEWTHAVCEKSEGEIIAIDGKKLRQSHDSQHGKAGLWLVNAWASENRLMLGQVPVEADSNEIPAIPEVLALLDITGCTVTLDAMGTQTEIARQIIDQGGDYVLAVKKNQGHLYEDLSALFDGFEQAEYAGIAFDTAKRITQGHNRREIRQCWVVDQPDYSLPLRNPAAWANLTSFIKLVSIRTVADETTVKIRYFISSRRASAQVFLALIRTHWQVENTLHWTLDVAFHEDASRIRKNHAPQNMGLVRRMATTLLKRDTSLKVGIAAKRKRAGWDNDYLLRVLCP